MCGIVGYVGKQQAAPILLDGLQRLEYRGYDSAGIAVCGEGGMRVQKAKGRLQVLKDLTHEGADLPGCLGIGHTRWATHGEPNDINAHPHVSRSGRIALVHNGIIENFAELKGQLLHKGYQFTSETDTEVVVQLLDYYYDQCGDMIEAVRRVLNAVEGAYAFGIVSADAPDTLIAAPKDAPLLLGYGEGENFIASDVTAIIRHTRDISYMEDGEMAVLTSDSITVYDKTGAEVTKKHHHVDWNIDAAEKGGYAHFMLKEIFEQPETLRNTIRGRLDRVDGTSVLAGLNLPPRDLASIRRAVIIGCGTSLHAAMVGKYLFESLADLPTSPEQAAEFRYCNPIIGPSDWAVAVSQSGETADTLAAVRESIGKGALVSAICNVVGSTIAREAGRGVYLHAGPEISVASTKAFTSQVTVLLMMALKLGRTRRLSREEGLKLCEEIGGLPDKVGEVLKENERIAAIAAKYAKAEDMFFLGRGILYPTALEGALKVKEISYVHAEGYQAAELKHGPIALLGEHTPVVALLNDIPGKEKTIGNVQECRARQAPVVGVVTAGDDEAARHCNDVIVVPRTSAACAPIVTAVALQLFAYHLARIRGCEIDQPRNLAKSVTVE